MIEDVKPSAKRVQKHHVHKIVEQVQTQNNLPSNPPQQRPQPPGIADAHPKVDFDIDELAIDDSPPVGVAPDDTQPEQSGPMKPKSNWKDKFKFSWPPKKKEWITSLVIVLFCGSAVAFILTHTGTKPVASAAIVPANKVKKVPVSDLVPSTLSGLPVNPAVNKIPVTALMVENSDFARPQAGLSQAGVVFEAIAEGGITRFMALYQDTSPGNIGPIRSARPYYLQWALGFDASLAHVGGSPDALNDINAWGVKDLNEFYNSGAYHRISSRAAPHNMYTSIAALNQVEASKGYNSVNFTGFPRKKESALTTPTAKSVNMNISWSDYAVHYDYDSATNSYNRSEGGAAMVDSNTGTQLSPKVVVAMIVPLSQGALDSTGAYYSDYQVVGNGAVYVFQDGGVTQGTWSKASPTSQITFSDQSGKPIKLNPGQTWLTALGSAGDLSYSP